MLGVANSGLKQRTRLATPERFGGCARRRGILESDIVLLPPSNPSEDFADYLNAALDPGDLLVISARPDTAAKTLRASAMATTSGTGGWSDNPAATERRPAPHPVIAGLSLLIAVPALVPIVGPSLGLMNWHIIAAVAGVVGLVFAAFVAREAINRAPAVTRLGKGNGVKVPTTAGWRLRRRKEDEPRPSLRPARHGAAGVVVLQRVTHRDRHPRTVSPIRGHNRSGVLPRS